MREQEPDTNNTILAFGHGALTVIAGRYDGRPAVFVRSVSRPGVVGEQIRPEEETPSDRLEPGEVVLTFPTAEQAASVAASMVDGDENRTSRYLHDIQETAHD